MADLPLDSPLSAHERSIGLLYGSLVGDSLTLPAHWIYDQAEIAQRFTRVTELQAADPEGYHPGKERGAQTHYGDQTLVLLESLEVCGGNFVMEDFARRWRQFWDTSKAYRDHATKETLLHLQEGRGLTQAASDSTELGGPGRIAPLLLALRTEEQPLLVGAVRAQTAMTHASPAAIDAAEFIAHTVLLLVRGVSIPSALRMAASLPYRALPVETWLRRVEELKDFSTAEAVAELGQSCPLDKALPAIFLILSRHGDNFETAMIENVMAGGDSAARGLVLGIFLGAAHGRRAIPQRWIEPLLAKPKIETFLSTVGL